MIQNLRSDSSNFCWMTRNLLSVSSNFCWMTQNLLSGPSNFLSVPSNFNFDVASCHSLIKSCHSCSSTWNECLQNWFKSFRILLHRYHPKKATNTENIFIEVRGRQWPSPTVIRRWRRTFVSLTNVRS